MSDLEDKSKELDEEFQLKGNEIDLSICLESIGKSIPLLGTVVELYNAHKQERRFKRLEEFYKELIPELENVKNRLGNILAHSKEELIDILERIHEKVESENINKKKEYYKNYFKKTFMFPVTKANYDQRKIFLDILSNLTYDQIRLLTIIIQKGPIVSSKITHPTHSPAVIQGSIKQLQLHGLINAQLNSISFTNVGGSMEEVVSISEFGKSFHEFCVDKS